MEPPVLTGTVTAAVLLGALLHAGWNLLVKRGADAAMDLAALTLAASLLVLPLLPWVGLPPRAAWPYLLASNLIHVGYYGSLLAAYRRADLGVAYPLMRGSAPLLVALAGAAWLGEWPGASRWLGIGLVSAGVISLAWSGGGQGARVVAVALLNAAMIAGYTVVDAAGARSAGTALVYVVWLFLLQGLVFAALLHWRRGPAFRAHLRARWRLALAGGACSALSYGIAVWAMTVAPVGAVAALRETSVVFAVLLGAAFLGERLTPARWGGVAAVLAGAAALRW